MENDQNIVGIAKLKEVLLEMKDPPCIEFNCHRIQDCRQKQLACEAFQRYVNTNKVMHPSMKQIGTKKVLGETRYVSDGVIVALSSIYKDVFSKEEDDDKVIWKRLAT